MTNAYGKKQWIDYEHEVPWIPGWQGWKGQGYGPGWKAQVSECPKLKDAIGTSFKKWSIEIRRWSRATYFTPDVRLLKVLDSLPENLKGLFQNIPDEYLFGPDGIDLVMIQVQIQCGLRPEDEFKDIMNASMETKRRTNESIAMWLYSVKQAWVVVENSQVCLNPDVTKIWLLEQGARLSTTQAQQFHTLMMGKETNLRHAENSYFVVDRVAA